VIGEGITFAVAAIRDSRAGKKSRDINRRT
jgi:hypothetical protein